MPSIPVYNQPQVNTTAAPGAKQQIGGTSLRAFGASDTMNDMAQLSGAVIKEREQESERRAAEEALRAESQFQRELIQKQSELRQRQGKNAEGVDAEADEWIASTAGKYLENIKDPRAKQLFDQKAMRARNNLLGWASGHVTQQRETALEIEWSSSKEVAIDLAINDSRPEIVQQSIKDIQQKNAFQAQRKGLGDEWIAAQNANDIGKLHSKILQNAIDSDSMDGVAGYLQSHGETMDAGTKAKAEKWLHKRQIDETAGAYADGLVANGVPYSEALAGARERFSGDDEDKYIARIKERYGEIEQQKRATERDLVDALNRRLYETGDITKVTDDDIDSIAAVNPARALDIKEQRERALELKAAGGDYAKESDIETRQKVDQLIMNGDLTDPRQLAMYRGSLDKGDYSAAETLLKKQGLLDQSGARQAYRELLPADKQKKNYVETEEDRIREAQFLKDAADFVRETHRPQDMKAFAADWNLKGRVKGTGYELPVIGVVGAKTITQGEAAATGVQFEPEKPLPRNVITQDYLDRRQQKTVVRTGIHNGRKVVQYSDGSTEYAQ